MLAVGVQHVALALAADRLEQLEVEGPYEPLLLLEGEALRCGEHGEEDARCAPGEAGLPVADQVGVHHAQRGFERGRVLGRERGHRLPHQVALELVPGVENRVQEEGPAAQGAATISTARSWVPKGVSAGSKGSRRARSAGVAMTSMPSGIG